MNRAAAIFIVLLVGLAGCSPGGGGDGCLGGFHGDGTAGYAAQCEENQQLEADAARVREALDEMEEAEMDRLQREAEQDYEEYRDLMNEEYRDPFGDY